MEPVTYFVTYGTAMAAYAYFVLTKQVRSRYSISVDCLIKFEPLFVPGISSARCQRPPALDHTAQISEEARPRPESIQ